MKLYAPAEYWKLDSATKALITNGCGPKGFGLFVPNKLLGRSIKQCCNIHDYMYSVGTTHECKLIADRVFLYNMLRTVENTKNSIVKWLRIHIAYKYYLAVSKFGGPAFWSGKNSPDEYQ